MKYSHKFLDINDVSKYVNGNLSEDINHYVSRRSLSVYSKAQSNNLCYKPLSNLIENMKNNDDHIKQAEEIEEIKKRVCKY